MSREFPPAFSGIGDHTDLLARALTATGITVTVVCAAPGEQRDGIAVVPHEGPWGAEGADALAGTVAGTTPDAILWQYNPFSFGRRGLARGAGAFARRLAAIAPLTVYLHELWFPWGRAGARGVVWAVAQRVQTRAVLRAASRWIVTTESREVRLRRMDARKVARIPVGTNVEPSGTDARAALGIPADAFVLAHFGSVGPGRDLAPAYEAVARMRAQGRDARVVLVGDTGPFTKPSGLNGAVVTTGRVAREDLSGALAAADAYLHADPVGPSAGRRTSLVAALAHGLPVIAYRGPDHATELSDDANIVMVDRDPAALAAALNALADDPARAQRLGAAARATFEASFSWPRIADAVALVLTESAR